MSAPDPDASPADPMTERRDALVERLAQAASGMLELCTVYLGDRLGLYAALADGGPLTSAELAARTGTHERYVREWLEQQTLAGVLEVDVLDVAAAAQRFVLPPGHAEVLADRSSPAYAAPMARVTIGATRPLTAVLEAFRTGAGVPYAAYGADLTEAMTEIDRPGHLAWPAEVLAPALPDLHARLLGDPPARVADIGCGAAWSSIGFALAYPQARVDGFDLDEASVALARRNVTEAGLSDRVHIALHDAGDSALAGSYDLVVVTLSLHDMTDPVAVLRAMRRLAGADGMALVVERRAAERFLGPETDSETERFFYPWSVLHCLPVGMSAPPAAGIGTLMRPPVLRAFAREAGFAAVEVILPEEAPQAALYRLRG